jgi:predicted ATPase
LELVGARCVTHTTDPGGVFIRVAPLTVLYGPNDSGKSQILQAITAGLVDPSDVENDSPRTLALYTEVTGWQLERLLTRCLEDTEEHLAAVSG